MDGWGGHCARCREEVPESDVEVHHVDRDRDNNDRDNLEVLCHGCHVQEHHSDSLPVDMVVAMPRPVLVALDKAVEQHGYADRSEAVCRAVVRAFDQEPDGMLSSPDEAVSAFFSGEPLGEPAGGGVAVCLPEEGDADG